MIVISNSISCNTLKSGKGYFDLPNDGSEYKEIWNDYLKTISTTSFLRVLGNSTVERVPMVPKL